MQLQGRCCLPEEAAIRTALRGVLSKLRKAQDRRLGDWRNSGGCPYGLSREVFQSTPASMKNPTDCNECTLCKRCRCFRKGDRVELSVLGILQIGRSAVNRGTVRGQSLSKRGVLIAIQWDSCPSCLLGQIPPKFLQRLFGEETPFL